MAPALAKMHIPYCEIMQPGLPIYWPFLDRFFAWLAVYGRLLVPSHGLHRRQLQTLSAATMA
jgi:hypothetical protein